MARIVLEHPPVSSPWHLPAGVAYLAAVLEQDGHEVEQRYSHLTWANACKDKFGDQRFAQQIGARKLHATGNNLEFVHEMQDGTLEGLLCALAGHVSEEDPILHEMLDVIRAEPQVYGVSVNDERQLFYGMRMASCMKSMRPNTLVVVGGNFWSRMGDSFWQHPRLGELFNHCDCIVFGEGFQPMRTLASRWDPEYAPATAWRDRRTGTVHRNPLTSEPTSFESLPTPVFDIVRQPAQWSLDVVLPLYTMSNCPQQCTFCAIAAGSDTFLGRPRAMTTRRIAQHMSALAARYGTTRFDITDETFAVPRQLELGQELRRIGCTATWQCYLIADDRLLDPQVCGALYNAGCRAVQIGLESLSRETLGREHKSWNHPENYAAILRNLRAAGIQTHVFIIVGLPGEPLHVNLRWLPFLEKHDRDILTIKASRYRLTRRSPEAVGGVSGELIDVLPDTRPLHLNRDFNYRGAAWSNQRVNAMRDLLDEACRRHWAYGVTSQYGWWANRGRYTWEELEQMARELPRVGPVSHLARALDKASTIAGERLGRHISLTTFEEAVEIGRLA